MSERDQTWWLETEDFPPEELHPSDDDDWTMPMRTDGTPSNEYLGNAIMIALCGRPNMTVGQAAEAFGVSLQRAAEAIAWHYWLYIPKDYSADTRIEVEGL